MSLGISEKAKARLHEHARLWITQENLHVYRHVCTLYMYIGFNAANSSEEFSEMVLEFALADAAVGYARAEHRDAPEPAAVTIAPHAEVFSIAILAVHLKGGTLSISSTEIC